ncbi:MAG TPA: glutamine synthetase adenylyltransferase [Planctomycetaceae bacterium]|nr:glutamine synthetase adenylyltransferase [Planctomycetaceae bacterium]
MFEPSGQLVLRADFPETEARDLLSAAGFADWALALRRLREIGRDDASRRALADVLPPLLIALSDAATPDASLLNFERYVQCVADRTALLRYLASKPRAVEILVKLFVGSQFLTEILLRNPDYLEKLTNHKQLADIKSRAHFLAEAREAGATASSIEARLDALRRYQRWELLRIGACDAFGLFDLKTVTVQLSLLADSLVQTCLTIFTSQLELNQEKFAVVAMGKLGGEELNYSSDIDLIFLAETDAARFWTLGQRLIKALTESTAEGFLYRVDMRLRPWGRSGALVNTIDGHVQYLKTHGMLWEKQALLKARVIAGDAQLGETFLKRVEALLFGAPIEQIRESIRGLKARIEKNLERRGRDWGEVKSGAGSIRDIEFVTQFLQLAHGREEPHVRSINTLDGLVRLADFSLIQADEYRQLASAYTFFRTIEHSLQLMHHKQTHSLPEDRRELRFLARRLDFADADQFLDYYNRHRASVRAIYRSYLDGKKSGTGVPESAELAAAPAPLHMEASYHETFDSDARARHLELLARLTEEAPVDVAATWRDDGCWQVTVVGFNHPGELAIICGLLFAYGCNIVDGNAFSEENVAGASLAPRSKARGSSAVADASVSKFVDVFTVEPSATPPVGGLPALWQNYAGELAELIREARSGRVGEVQGRLAKRVASAVPATSETATTLYPVEIEIDNESSPRSTVLRIHSEDTMGFLYELANALALAGIDISRMIVDSRGNRAFDTLYVTDVMGEKITDPGRQSELRAAIVLIKHFTHLLPRSPNPEAALLHFRDFLAQLFQQPDWLHELASLEQSDVLAALARLLGVSDFLWEDFLRLQHANLFPVVRDISGLERRKSRESLTAELNAEVSAARTTEERRERLNAFKDREMFRADMRHILGLVGEFGQFSAELGDVAEVVVGAALAVCLQDLERRFGHPRGADGRPARVCACALGKCGGRELGYASDIELMFIYDGNGSTTGPEVIGATEFYQRLVEAFTHTIRSREEGVFQVDLRLRPYGRAGSLAVSLDAFSGYFGAEGAAWPYERQALVKLRSIAGDLQFGAEIVALRDRLIYSGEPFDVAAMRAMREKQLRQLVRAGTTNAKLSPGQLVDTEYLVQGLQITYGHLDPSLRAVNTLDALAALKDRGLVSADEAAHLREAYVFQRDLIDALRIVRGHARDLTVPAPDSEEFVFLSRRLGYGADVNRLGDDIERFAETVRQLSRLLDR